MTTNNETGHADHVTYRLETSRDLLDRLGGELTHRARIGRESREEHEGGPAGPTPKGQRSAGSTGSPSSWHGSANW